MRRVIVYAVDARGRGVDPYINHALTELRRHADSLIVIACGTTRTERAALADYADIVRDGGSRFSAVEYARALADHAALVSGVDEVVLSGDSWFGPLATLGGVLSRMDVVSADVWTMVERRIDRLPDTAYALVSERRETWMWTAVRRPLLSSEPWRLFWRKADDLVTENAFVTQLVAMGAARAHAFSAEDYGNDDPSVYSPDLLVQNGVPIVRIEPFVLYPPFLSQHAVLGRDLVAAIDVAGYPMPLLWQHLARTVAPKSLNAAAGMLEVVTGSSSDVPRSVRIAVVAHISDLDGAREVFDRLQSIPDGFGLIVTTTDGQKAVAIERMLAEPGATGAGLVDIRVSPSKRGRDMSDFFIACRDVLVEGRYDLVFKVHSRPSRRKTVNVRRYFRRYQLDNLMNSREHVVSILEMFAKEPGLGLVFPPMIHIGFATMGRGGRDYQRHIEAARRELGIGVPLENVSPLAPYGGMWVGRPEALQAITDRSWQYRDYGKPGRARYRDLARLQERLVASVAAESGFHSRTVLTSEHAAISHTNLEYKTDELFSASHGYPVDAIRLLHRAGPSGRGGAVGLARMYLRLNHRALSVLLLPLLGAAQWAFFTLRGLRDRGSGPRREHWSEEDL